VVVDAAMDGTNDPVAGIANDITLGDLPRIGTGCVH